MSQFIYSKIFDSSPLPIYILQDGFFRMANSKMAQITGYSPEELLRLHFSRVIHPADREMVVDNALRRLAGEEVAENYEFRAVNRKGETIHISGFFSTIEFAGRPATLGQIIDITEQKKAEEAQRASEEKYRVVVENANEAILVAQDGKIKFVNPKTIKMVGYSREELIDRPFTDFIHPDDCEMVMGRYIKRLAGQDLINRYPFRIVDREGIIKWVEINAAMVKWEGMPATLNFLNDITDSRQAEIALRESERKYRTLVETIQEGISIVDPEERIVYCNAAFAEIFELPQEELMGKSLLEFLDQQQQQEILKQTAIRRTNKRSVYEATLTLKNRVQKIVSVSASPFFDPDGNYQGAVGAVFDITDRKRAEERFKYLSLHDALTGLYNRTYFEQEMLRLEGSRFTTAGIVICDIDGLKLVNDTLGHASGDALLVAAAGIIKNSFRRGDMAARIGGDEFAVLLPNSPCHVVENACRRIRNAADRYNNANPDIPLSISIGFAVGDNMSWDLFKEADNNMYREKLHRSRSARSAIVHTLMKALEARDFITEGHADRLQDLVTRMSSATGQSGRKLSDLRLLAQFHDIGKVGIPDRILFKAGPLTSEEYAEMQRHCEIGYRIAQSATDLNPIADWILKHHECWDGSGYPLGLKGLEIPLECRILAIADAYDAMTSDRPYRKAMTSEKALAEIERCAGTQFDPHLVRKFKQVIKTRNYRETVK